MKRDLNYYLTMQRRLESALKQANNHEYQLELKKAIKYTIRRIEQIVRRTELPATM